MKCSLPSVWELIRLVLKIIIPSVNRLLFSSTFAYFRYLLISENRCAIQFTCTNLPIIKVYKYRMCHLKLSATTIFVGYFSKLSRMNTCSASEYTFTPHSFCATFVSSGLATSVALTRVSRWNLGEFITRGVGGGRDFDLIFVP